MRFQMKLIVVYSALVFVLTSIVGIVFFKYSMNRYEQTEFENLRMMSQKAVQQFEDSLKPMEQISDYLLSDLEVLNALHVLADLSPDTDLKKNYIENAQSMIQSRLNSYYITKNFHRVIIFNKSGTILASKNYSASMIRNDVDISGIPWLETADTTYGEQVLVGPHMDDWSIRNQTEVFSTVKRLIGESLGYIEVQRSADELRQIFDFSDARTEVVVFLNSDQLFYSNMDIPSEFLPSYQIIADNIDGQRYEWMNPQTGRAQVYVQAVSESEKIQLFLFKDKADIAANAAYVAPLIILMVCVVIIFSVIYIVAGSFFLTKPIQGLREQVEKTQLKHLGEEIMFHTNNDEIQALALAYQDMRIRLNESIVKERQLSLLQLKAQYNTLQAQVNPHFLYNILNVISSRAMLVDDEVIDGICHNLASILRYSTNTKNKEATVREEVMYVEQYFLLLKARYEHKLQYTIEVEEPVKDEMIPKIMLQQIVENCISHGFTQSNEVMRISLKGWNEGDWWYIQIDDNGEGFHNESIKNLKQEMNRIKVMIIELENNIEMEIGGMGIVNCYARLLLFKGLNVKMDIKNHENGARVVIGAQTEKGRKQDVSNDDY